MLVLTRKVGEVITLGNPRSLEKAIQITVVDIQGTDVKLGFDAPVEIAVHRREIWEQKKLDKQAAEVQATE